MDSLSMETLELLQETAVKASGASDKLALMTAKAEPDHVYLAVKPDGSYERRVADPKPRSHTLGSLDQVIPYVEEKGAESTVIWYNETGVTVVLDDNTRRDFARLAFTPTPQFEKLKFLDANRPGLPQRDFRKLIRIDLAGCFENSRLLNWVSDVKFGSASNSLGNLRNERESLGKDIDAQAVSGAGEIPEDVPLSVRLFDDASLVERQGIMCIFDLAIQDQQFRLIPLPLEIHSALEREVAYIGEKLTSGLLDLKVPLFRGYP